MLGRKSQLLEDPYKRAAEIAGWVINGGHMPPMVVRNGLQAPVGADQLRPSVLTLGGGGANVPQFGIEALVTATNFNARLIIAASAGCFPAILIARAKTDEDRWEAARLIASVRLEELLAAPPRTRFQMPWLGTRSLKMLESWTDEKSDTLLWQELEYNDTDNVRPDGLEGWTHKLNFTVTVVVADPFRMKQVAGDEFADKETAELNFWRLVLEDLVPRRGHPDGIRQLKNLRLPRLRQYVFPRDLFSNDPKNPYMLGELGWLLSPLFDTPTYDGAWKWLRTERVSPWACNSSRSPYGVLAEARRTLFEHGIGLLDGDAAGPVPLLGPGEKSRLPLIHLTMDHPSMWKAYRGTEVSRVAMASPQLNPMHFSRLNPRVGAEMAARGFLHAMHFDPASVYSAQSLERVGEVPNGRFPLSARSEVAALTALAYSLPPSHNVAAMLDAGAEARDRVVAAFQAWRNPSPQPAYEPAFEPAFNLGGGLGLSPT